MRAYLFPALVGGLLTGCVLAALQVGVVTPWIVAAEAYEEAESEPASEAHSAHAAHGHGDHHHDSGAYEPDGAARTWWTVVGGVNSGVAFALLLAASIGGLGLVPRTGAVGWGLVFGAVGFVVFHAVPALGVPPTPPGVPEAPLGERQSWWLLAVVASGLAAVAFVMIPRLLKERFGWDRARGVVAALACSATLLAVPFLMGVPDHPAAGSAVPHDLIVRYRFASLGSNAVFWLVLGAVVTWLVSRASQRAMPEPV